MSKPASFLAAPLEAAKVWWRGKSAVLRFGLSLAGLMGLYYVVALTPLFDGLLERCLVWNAHASNTLLNLVGQKSVALKTTIRSVAFAINVRRGCDAFEPAWFFVAAILSFPAPFLRKIGGIAAGCSIIFAINIIRISSLFLIGLYWPKFFATAHLEIWPMVIILVSVLLWIGWIAWIRETPNLGKIEMP